MKPHPSMSSDESHLFDLYCAARRLGAADVKELEMKLVHEQFSLEIRTQLLCYYSSKAGDEFKDSNADEKLLALVLWFIENTPAVSGFLSRYIVRCGNSVKPKTFALLREAWFQQVDQFPLDGNVLGNAASFIVWNDTETASPLFERAYAMQPSAGWLGTYIIFRNADLGLFPKMYHNEIRKHIIDIGVRSLRTEPGGAPFLTCEYVADAALELNRLDLVQLCVDTLRSMRNHPVFEQLAQAYVGLVAMRLNDYELAIRSIELEKGYEPHHVVLRLASELLASGEKESVVRLIQNFKHKVKASKRNEWLAKIQNDEIPDFSNLYR